MFHTKQTYLNNLNHSLSISVMSMGYNVLSLIFDEILLLRHTNLSLRKKCLVEKDKFVCHSNEESLL